MPHTYVHIYRVIFVLVTPGRQRGNKCYWGHGWNKGTLDSTFVVKYCLPGKAVMGYFPILGAVGVKMAFHCGGSLTDFPLLFPFLGRVATLMIACMPSLVGPI